MTDLQDRTKPEAARCQCGHIVAGHRWMPATKTLPARRGECTFQDATGKCECRKAAMTAIGSLLEDGHDLA